MQAKMHHLCSMLKNKLPIEFQQLKTVLQYTAFTHGFKFDQSEDCIWLLDRKQKPLIASNLYIVCIGELMVIAKYGQEHVSGEGQKHIALPSLFGLLFPPCLC